MVAKSMQCCLEHRKNQPNGHFRIDAVHATALSMGKQRMGHTEKPGKQFFKFLLFFMIFCYNMRVVARFV
ncbi:hypothetical protein A3A64_02100 [Candidatus Gottesmanbacteria bacterium RIFCSPLOWO2_01_FULL_48_11]|uniref:Uncharacterized protein n=1 Tax=Candidatus Gottesmanbacteria bacterium RIFCSPLOWO2_01_FULL_48_11 TaxID=1798395 RepID=A0A1F6AR56_9BACT|nr:MAG: hypothetical protein A3A64_02100 [Candidatus Gottesmanbacteria bacterium RIFCSPLOWO2_01_FULL_48_11]